MLLTRSAWEYRLPSAEILTWREFPLRNGNLRVDKCSLASFVRSTLAALETDLFLKIFEFANSVRMASKWKFNGQSIFCRTEPSIFFFQQVVRWYCVFLRIQNVSANNCRNRGGRAIVSQPNLQNFSLNFKELETYVHTVRQQWYPDWSSSWRLKYRRQAGTWTWRAFHWSNTESRWLRRWSW